MEAASKQCPSCGLLNTANGDACECGYQFNPSVHAVAASKVSGGRKRPFGVWLIALYFCFSACWTVCSLLLVRSGAFELSPAQRAYFDGLTLVDYAASFILGLLSLSGGLALFLLRKQALYLLGAALAGNVAVTLWFNKGFFAALSETPGALAGVFIGWAILLAVFMYARKLSQLGVLQ